MIGRRSTRAKVPAVTQPPLDFKPERRWHIGIDPGRNTGLAVYDRREKVLVHLATTDFHGVLDYLAANIGPSVCVVAVEEPSGNVPVFREKLDKLEGIRPMLKLAQNIGANKREADLLIAALRRRGYHVNAFTPRTKKWSEEYFKTITGWQGRSSEHSRDAARAVFGL